MRIFGAILIMAVALVACGSLSESEPAPTRTPNASSDTAVADDCPDCLSVQDVMDEYKANPLRAERTYWNTRHTVGGVIDKMRGSNSAIGFERGPEVKLTNGVWLTLAWGEPQEWEWLMEKNVGDSIRVNCRIKMLHSNESGLPVFDECWNAEGQSQTKGAKR